MESSQKPKGRNDTVSGIYPKEHTTGYNRDVYTPMFITALFLIAKLWKQTRCPTTYEWIKKM
jgi:hypothetical protein